LAHPEEVVMEIIAVAAAAEETMAMPKEHQMPVLMVFQMLVLMKVHQKLV
jgi:hypothetical protein